jgi:hypothetical protein
MTTTWTNETKTSNKVHWFDWLTAWEDETRTWAELYYADSTNLAKPD